MDVEFVKCFASKEGVYPEVSLCFDEEDYQNVWRAIKNNIVVDKELLKKYNEGETIKLDFKLHILQTGKKFTLVVEAKRGERVVLVDLVEEG